MVPAVPSPVSRRARRSVLARFRRDRRGVTAVEFALVAPIFFALLLGIFETAFSMLSNQLMETAVIDSSRLILTGQAQTQTFSASRFKTEVCNRVPSFIDCSGKVSVDVQKIGAFNTAVSVPKDANGNFDPSKMTFNMGGPDDIIMVRIYYKWAGLIAGIVKNFGLDLGNQPDGTTLMVSTMVFKNEPYK